MEILDDIGGLYNYKWGYLWDIFSQQYDFGLAETLGEQP